METRRRRGGKSVQAAASDPPVRPPSPASESTAESGKESEAELADIGATGVGTVGPLPLPCQGMLIGPHPQELEQDQKGLSQRQRLPLSVSLKEGWLPPEMI